MKCQHHGLAEHSQVLGKRMQDLQFAWKFLQMNVQHLGLPLKKNDTHGLGSLHWSWEEERQEGKTWKSQITWFEFLERKLTARAHLLMIFRIF